MSKKVQLDKENNDYNLFWDFFLFFKNLENNRLIQI